MIELPDTVVQDSEAAPAPADVVLKLEGIKKAFGSLQVLDGLNLQVHEGEVFGFLGRNGAGKDDLIKIRQQIGYVAQDQNMYPWMTPKIISKFVKGFYPSWSQERYQTLLDDFELPPKRRIGTFSGGMKAKLALTLALATRPRLLILDEPTAGMDPVARREFLDLVREHTVKDGATTFFSTHLIDEIEAVADRIAIVESGKTIYDGTLEPLRQRINSWSIPMSMYQPGDMPGDFVMQGQKILKQQERKGRWVVTVQFSTDMLSTTQMILNEGWRHEAMSLEDVFIAIVASR